MNNIHRLKYVFLSLLLLANTVTALAQQYEVGRNVHSHNDYEQRHPFYTAYKNGLASMEIDVFQVGDELYVAHKEEEIYHKKTIESLYLDPLLKQIKQNGNNKAYKNGKGLQLMIDLKTSGIPALRCLEAKLKPLRMFFDVRKDPNAVKLVITGDTPPPAMFNDFDEIFYFDGKRGTFYNEEQLKRIAFFSTNFRDFSKWKGVGRMTTQDSLKVKNFVDSVHQVGKPIRFWGNPDTKNCWVAFMKMGVDFLNTDMPARIAKFLARYADLTGNL